VTREELLKLSNEELKAMRYIDLAEISGINITTIRGRVSKSGGDYRMAVSSPVKFLGKPGQRHPREFNPIDTALAAVWSKRALV